MLLWRRFIKKHNLKHVVYHGLRASYASYLYNRGIPIKEISESLGHSKTRTTDKYYLITDSNTNTRISEVTNDFKRPRTIVTTTSD
ncbi:MAG: tyrosine-type recombinase/integrase [Bacilli bacterium]